MLVSYCIDRSGNNYLIIFLLYINQIFNLKVKEALEFYIAIQFQTILIIYDIFDILKELKVSAINSKIQIFLINE